MLWIGSPLATRSQEDPLSDRSFSELVSVDFVLVPVVVDGAKGPIQDLAQNDFELLVDGQPVSIESFETGETPATLFFLQDLSGSMELVGKLRSSRRILDFFLDRAGLGDRFAMLTFAGRRVDTLVPLTDDVSQMREAARTWRAYGITALHDAVALLPELVLDQPSSRRAVLLVSDGLDNASGLSATEARDRIRASEIPVYVIGLDTGSPFELDSEGQKRYRYADVMNLLGSPDRWPVLFGLGYEPAGPGDHFHSPRTPPSVYSWILNWRCWAGDGQRHRSSRSPQACGGIASPRLSRSATTGIGSPEKVRSPLCSI